MTDPASPPPSASRWGRLLVLAVFVLGVVLVFTTGVKDTLTLDTLSANRARLLEFVELHAVGAVLVFMGVYIAATALSVPGAIWLTIAGGFVFGPIFGTLYTVVAATIGASLIFLIARYVLGDTLRAKAGPALKKMEAGFQANALSYLLVLRLVPLFPFFLVNLVPAFLAVPLRTFVIGTFFGIIPGTFVFSTVGAGFGDALAAGATVDPGAVLKQPTVIGALLGLALLSLVPVVYRRIKARG
ncbi:MAG: TVP38/TMEM64 family protein [Rhodospirillaceae bacterium]|nr:TVP38/TMEM64 family protein [Rhodospirillaceae bacterium]